MKAIDRICLILITISMIYTSWTVHGAMVRLVREHEANTQAYKVILIKTLEERNLAEAHVAYLERQMKLHRSGWKK